MLCFSTSLSPACRRAAPSPAFAGAAPSSVDWTAGSFGLSVDGRRKQRSRHESSTVTSWMNGTIHAVETRNQQLPTANGFGLRSKDNCFGKR